MIIELRGVEFQNKGAELMLRAILDKVRKQYPEAIFVMETRKNVPVYKTSKHGIKTKFVFRKKGFDLSFVGDLIPKFLRSKKNIVLEKEIDIVLDASGFAYGDFWGAKKANEKLSIHLKRWRRQGKKIILLPQALGAFENKSMQNEMRYIASSVDLIFARDKYSFKHLKDIVNKDARIIKKPDFTNLIEGVFPENLVLPDKYFLIIPNNKIVESAVFEDRNDYITFLAKVANYSATKGIEPVFLNHEGERDFQLLKEVNTHLEKEVLIINEEDPLIIKGIIGKSYAVFTSRFHGLVSALSQCVPTLCLGWSHKYLAILEEYQFNEGLIDRDVMRANNIESMLDDLLKLEHNQLVRKQLQDQSLKQKGLSEEMWDIVFETIKG